MNKRFANVLQVAVQNKKLNNTKLVSTFISTHGVDSSSNEIEVTPEISEFIDQFFIKKLKCNDKQLMSFFEGLRGESPVKETVTKKTNSYSAPEH